MSITLNRWNGRVTEEVLAPDGAVWRWMVLGHTPGELDVWLEVRLSEDEIGLLLSHLIAQTSLNNVLLDKLSRPIQMTLDPQGPGNWVVVRDHPGDDALRKMLIVLRDDVRKAVDYGSKNYSGPPSDRQLALTAGVEMLDDCLSGE